MGFVKNWLLCTEEEGLGPLTCTQFRRHRVRSQGAHTVRPNAGDGTTRLGSRHSLALASALSRHHVGPKRLDFLSLQEIAPRRHLVLAARHGADEALVLLMRKLAKIKRGLR